ncbi:VC0807 family protein [Streptomyces sp. NPDC007157]|uniref:VC0807 family protein n=1 Tax=Streptomyces sp. NPDC007157 TaxID=3154681 RepID=UPI0034070049
MTKTTNAGSPNSNQDKRQPSVLENFKPLIVDVAVPLGSYYLFKGAFGMSTFAALAWSSVVPALRTVWSVVKERRGNAFAGLILLVNLVSLALSFVSGDPRLMLAKDSGVSSAIGIAILVSVAMGRPMMTEGLKPFVLKGDAAREAAFERLRSGSAAFRRSERVYSLVWGVLLLAECVVRIVGAYTLPVDTMVWLGTVILVGAIGIGMVVSGGLAAEPMARMISAEVTAMAGTSPEGAEETAGGVKREVAVAA